MGQSLQDARDGAVRADKDRQFAREGRAGLRPMLKEGRGNSRAFVARPGGVLVRLPLAVADAVLASDIERGDADYAGHRAAQKGALAQLRDAGGLPPSVTPEMLRPFLELKDP